jgi:prepilin-type N-terminal cleavage/methylation domain-containing protein
MITSQRGYSLLEVLVATLLLGIVAVGIASSLNLYYNDFAHLVTTSARDRYLKSVVSTIETRISQMEISFDPNATLNKDPETFSYFWAPDYEIVSAKDCTEKLFKGQPKCPLKGRMNYMIKPISGTPNMFETTIYFYHPRLNGGQAREYVYFLSVK